MVNKSKSMGWQLNIEQRKKLIYLYKQYIKDRDNSDDFFTESAEDFDKEGTEMFYSDVVNKARNATWRMQEKFPPHKRMSVEEAKEILKKLEDDAKDDE